MQRWGFHDVHFTDVDVLHSVVNITCSCFKRQPVQEFIGTLGGPLDEIETDGLTWRKKKSFVLP